MASFEIIVDSAANIPAALRKEHNISVIPYHYLVDGEERLCFDENVPFEETAKQLYDDMRAGADVKTSLLSEEHIQEAIVPVLEAGKDVFLLLISSGVSGTYQQAVRAAEELKGRYPERKIEVVDSKNASMGEGTIALRVASLRDMGESLEACAEWARVNAYKVNSYLTVGDLKYLKRTYKVNSYLTVGDLKYLKRTGRISTTLAIAGTLLNIKPVLRADGSTNAKIVFEGREHGRKKALMALARKYSERVDDVSAPVFITHADCEEDAKALAEMLRGMGASNIVIEYYDLCTGSHVGPGTVALFFTGKDRRRDTDAFEAAPAGAPVPSSSR